MKFFKYQGAGNDFILIDDFQKKVGAKIKKHIPSLCDRHFGIGADGVILLQSSRLATAKMKFFNPDGGEACLCGNGLRCAVKHLKMERVSIETGAGICLGENRDNHVAATIPNISEILSPLAIGVNRVGHLIDTGVPHLIIESAEFEREDFTEYARDLRYHTMFAPDGVNVSLIKQDGADIHIRTYERGVEGETLACGTACAASVAVIRKGDNKSRLRYTVYPKSKDALHFTFDSQERVWMQGPAELVFHGDISLKEDKKVIKQFESKRG